MTELFRPSLRAAVVFIVVGCAAIAAGMYVRYQLVEQSSVGLACEAGLGSFSCTIRKHAIALFTNAVFGGAAVIVAALNLVRPSPVLFAPALALAGLGIVLYNVNLSALAVALLVLSLALRAPEPE